MAYRLDSISFTSDMGPDGMAQVSEIWGDIASGKLPLLVGSDGKPAPGMAPVTEYTEYAGVNEGKPITTTIRVVAPEFFADLNRRTEEGELHLYETAADTIEACSMAAWQLAQAGDKDGTAPIDYSYCIESTVPPQYTKDGQAHCYLYIKTAS